MRNKSITSKSLSVELQNSGYGCRTSDTSSGGYGPAEGALFTHLYQQCIVGISLFDQPGWDRGHILPACEHPRARRRLCHGRLAGDQEQVAHAARADLCQEGGAGGGGAQLVQSFSVFNSSRLCVKLLKITVNLLFIKSRSTCWRLAQAFPCCGLQSYMTVRSSNKTKHDLSAHYVSVVVLFKPMSISMEQSESDL